jgi:hypothetical protein
MVHGIEACFYLQFSQNVGGYSGGPTQDLAKLPRWQLCQKGLELVTQGEVADGWLEGWRVVEKIQERCHYVQRVMDYSREAPALGVSAAHGAPGGPIEKFVRGETHKSGGPGKKLVQCSLVHHVVQHRGESTKDCGAWSGTTPTGRSRKRGNLAPT